MWSMTRRRHMERDKLRSQLGTMSDPNATKKESGTFASDRYEQGVREEADDIARRIDLLHDQLRSGQKQLKEDMEDFCAQADAIGFQLERTYLEKLNVKQLRNSAQRWSQFISEIEAESADQPEIDHYPDDMSNAGSVSDIGAGDRHVMTYWMHERYAADTLSEKMRMELQQLDTLIFSISDENRELGLLTELQDQHDTESQLASADPFQDDFFLRPYGA